MTKRLLVKQCGRLEEFDEQKVFKSVFSASLNAHLHEDEAQTIATSTTKDVVGKVQAKDHITTEEIREFILLSLGKTDVAFLYLHHYDIN